jgi:hypothetical protein
VHERRAPRDAGEGRHLERAAGSDVDGLVVGVNFGPEWQPAQPTSARSKRVFPRCDALEVEAGGGGGTACTQPVSALR